MRLLLLFIIIGGLTACQSLGTSGMRRESTDSSDASHAERVPTLSTLFVQLKLDQHQRQQMMSARPKTVHSLALIAVALSAPDASYAQRNQGQVMMKSLLGKLDEQHTGELNVAFLHLLYRLNEQLLESENRYHGQLKQTEETKQQLVELQGKLDALREVEKELDPIR